MAAAHKHRVTGRLDPLPFERLSPDEFEELCLWLAVREGYEQVEPLGEKGNEQGRDLIARRAGRRVAFQCKRVEKFGAADARTEIAKLLALPSDERPHELVFVITCGITAKTRSAAVAAWGDESTCQFWFGKGLNERVERHPDLPPKFFLFPFDRTRESPIQNLGPSLGDNFKGRTAELLALREALLAAPAGRATAIAGKAIHGLGGVGKSRLAIEYAWRYAADYAALFFVGAGSPADLQRNLAALAEARLLDLPEKDATEEPVRVAAVLAWLREHSGWLLILDNVDDEASAVAVENLVGSLLGGHVLLTGRLARWGANVEPIELDVLSEPAAVEFLLTRTDKRRRRKSDDDARAKEIARALGYLPLALEQAGAYIAEWALSFAGYLEEWKRRRDKVLEWYDARVMNYPASVAVTWLTSVERLSAGARRLLERLAWLAPDPIPETLLNVAIPGTEEESGAARDAVAELAAYSLVTRSREEPATFWVHRLVQEVSRRWQERAESAVALEEALRWVDAGFEGDPDDVRSWPTLDPLVAHARAVCASADRHEIAEPTTRLLNQIAVLLITKALHAEAEPLMRRALAVNEASFGIEHPRVAVQLNNLAQLLKATNRLAEAEPLMRRALAVDEASFGAEHPKVAIRLTNLAALLLATSRLAEAEPLMRRALAIDEPTFGAEHPHVATDLNNLAQLLKATNRLAEAEPLMRRALAIDEASFGAGHPNVARDLNNLALLLKATNRLSEAESLMRRALAIDQASFGADHPEVATILTSLAALLLATNRLSEAEPLMRRALLIFLSFTRNSGHQHPHFETARGNYERLLVEMDRSEDQIRAEIAALVSQFGA